MIRSPCPMQKKDQYHTDLTLLAKSGFLILLGNILRMLLGFCLHVMIIRSIGRAEFGLFSLALALASFVTVLAQLGFPQAIPRLIAQARALEEHRKIKAFILTSFSCTLILSWLLVLLLAPQAHILAISFHKPGLEPVFKILIYITPFMALLDLLVAQLRAFEEIWGKVLFKDLLQPLLGIGLIGLAIFLSLPFTLLCKSYIASFALAAGMLLIYTLFQLKKRLGPLITPVRKGELQELFTFCLPLLGAGLATQLLIWCDTIFLGWFVPAQELALYNGAFRLARMLTLFLLSGIFIYLPLTSRLIARQELQSVRQLYTSLSKWIFLISLPLLMFMFIAPEMTLQLILGPRYVGAALVLRLLSLGFGLHICFGPTAQNTIALGKPQVNFFSLVITLTLNILIDLLLIPRYGILGAALALIISMLVSNLIITWYGYHLAGLQPFKKNYLKIIGLASATISVLAVLQQNRHIHPFVLILVCLVVPPVLLVLSRSISEDDLFLFHLLLNKIKPQTPKPRP